MSTYTATATRQGLWWVIDVDRVGVTQSPTLVTARESAQGLIEAVTGEAGADVEVLQDPPVPSRLTLVRYGGGGII